MTGWIDPELSDADVAAVVREWFVMLTWRDGDREERERLAGVLTDAVMHEVVLPLREDQRVQEAARIKAVEARLRSEAELRDCRAQGVMEGNADHVKWKRERRRAEDAEAERDRLRDQEPCERVMPHQHCPGFDAVRAQRDEALARLQRVRELAEAKPALLYIGGTMLRASDVLAALDAPLPQPAPAEHEWVPCPRHMIPFDCGTCCDLPFHDPVHRAPLPEPDCEDCGGEDGMHSFACAVDRARAQRDALPEEKP